MKTLALSIGILGIAITICNGLSHDLYLRYEIKDLYTKICIKEAQFIEFERNFEDSFEGGANGIN